MKVRLSQISFFNGVPQSVVRGIGPHVTSKQAEMFYDTELGLIEFRRTTPPTDPMVHRFSNVGVAMVFGEAARPVRLRPDAAQSTESRPEHEAEPGGTAPDAA